MMREIAGVRSFSSMMFIIWIPYVYNFRPLDTITQLPILYGYHFIMMLLAIFGSLLLYRGNLLGFRILFFATLMYIFYLVLEYTWVLESLPGALKDPTGNPILDYLQSQYMIFKVLPNTEISLYKKVYLYYQWGFMPITQILLLLILPTVIYKYKKMPYNKSLQPTAKSAAG